MESTVTAPSWSSAFDHPKPVRSGLADPRVDVATVRIDCHVAVPRPMVLAPVLKQVTVDAENICGVGAILQPLEAEDVATGRRDAAIAVLPVQLVEGDLRELPRCRNVVGERDQAAVLVDRTHHEPVPVPRQIAFSGTEFEALSDHQEAKIR